MKFLLRSAFSLLFVFDLSGAGAQNFDNPGEYFGYINAQQHNINKKFMSYASASAHGKRARKVENLRNKLLNEVQESKMNINSMPSYKGEKELRDSAVNFMKLYFNILNEDYSKIINLEDVAEQSYDEMEAYLMAKELVDKKLEEGNARLKEAKIKFAARNNINLIEDKSDMGKMMEEVHLLNEHYNDIYLIFFKPYKQELYMMEAVEKGNITGIEQNKSALLKYAQEGLEKLKSMKSLSGDNSLITGCRSMLEFYIKETDKIPSISEFFLVKERFENMKKEFEKKSRPSKEEIDAYNKAVVDINKASQVYNETNKHIYERRSDLLNTWNKTVTEFFDEHTPRYK
jgi:hypothetical protein